MELKLLRNKKKRRPLRYTVLCAVFVLFLIYSVYSIATINLQIKEKKEQYNSIQNEIGIQELKNSELDHVLHYSDQEYLDYVINKAHSDLDYVRQGERVFIISAGE